MAELSDKERAKALTMGQPPAKEAKPAPKAAEKAAPPEPEVEKTDVEEV